MTPTRCPSFATAMRMIHWVHHYSAHRGSNSPPATGTCLTKLMQIMFGVANLTDGRTALGQNLAHFP